MHTATGSDFTVCAVDVIFPSGVPECNLCKFLLILLKEAYSSSSRNPLGNPGYSLSCVCEGLDLRSCSSSQGTRSQSLLSKAGGAHLP